MKRIVFVFLAFVFIIVSCSKSEDISIENELSLVDEKTESNSNLPINSPQTYNNNAYTSENRDKEEVNPEKAFALFNSSEFTEFVDFVNQLNQQKEVDVNNEQLQKEILGHISAIEGKVDELEVNKATVLAYLPKSDLAVAQDSKFYEDGLWGVAPSTCCADALAAYNLCQQNAINEFAIFAGGATLVIIGGIVVGGLSGGAGFAILGTVLSNAGISTSAAALTLLGALSSCQAIYNQDRIPCPCQCSNEPPLGGCL